LGGAAADGVLAECVVIDEASLKLVPAHLTDEQAATLPCAGVTAWSALIPFGGIRPGDSVVVLGTGGVLIFAMQFARLVGARVIATSHSDQQLARAKELGADPVINYKTTPARSICHNCTTIYDTTQAKNSAHLPIPQHSVKTEVIFCVRGVTTPP
jgi:NADPH:quinone reductase-like Zn-dependent oxidoreductase